MERTKEVLDKYINPKELKNEEIRKKLTEILQDTQYNDSQLQNIFITLLSCTDFTSLESTDNKENIWKFVERINKIDDKNSLLPNVASVCVYPNLIPVVREALTTEEVNICSVSGGFPSGQTYGEIKIAETALAISEGADEIDMVMNIGNILNEDYEEVITEIEEVKSTCRDKILKVILETGALKKAEIIAKASVIAMYSGADFIKTSTGKIHSGVTPEAVYTICLMIKKYYTEHDKKIGIKIAGRIKSIDEAVNYYKIIDSILGKDWLNKKLFRIGTSKLLDPILNSIEA